MNDSTMTLEGLSGALSTMVPRFHLATMPPDGAVPLSRLSDPEVCRALVADHRAARALDDAGIAKTKVVDQIAASLTVQGLAMHLSAIGIASMVLYRTLPIAHADDVFVKADGITFSVAITDAVLPGPVDDPFELVDAFATHWIDGHLRSVVDAVRATTTIGEALVWGSVAATVSSNFVFLDWWERSDLSRRLAAVVLERGNPSLAAHCSMHDLEVDGRIGLRSDRRACCLAIKIPNGHVCPTCPMVTEEERIASTAMHVGHLNAVLARR